MASGPEPPLVRTLAERLALAGTPHANLRVTTTFAVALTAAAPALVARGLDPAPHR